MIRLNGKTKATTETERLLWEIGGKPPGKSLSEKELSAVLAEAIRQMAEHKPHLLKRIYENCVEKGVSPPLDDPAG